MLRFHTTNATCAVACAVLLIPVVAQAHFVLMSPASWMSQDPNGLPEKLGPCGNEGGGTPTGTITAFRPGEMITIQIREVIPHPGHYRVALAVHDRSEFPKEPEVDAGDQACGTAKVENPAVFPVLGDGLLEHSAAFSGPQTMQVRLPSNVTCTKCTLQVIEFMSEHGLNQPGGCFYHHCADISIQGEPVDAGPVQDGGGSPVQDGDGGAGAPGGSGNGDMGMGSSSSGGCAMPPGERPAAAGSAGVFALMLFLRRRWRRGQS